LILMSLHDKSNWWPIRKPKILELHTSKMVTLQFVTEY
jgi:hypothetical protein